MNTALQRFWARVDKTDTCWLWNRVYKGNSGYGTLSINGKETRAHRFSYETFVGPIPKGMTIDHLCRVRNCVNPEHLEPVTPRENTLRGTAPSAFNKTKTHCKKGHLFAGNNLYVNPRGDRNCKTCKAIWQKDWQIRRQLSGYIPRRRWKQNEKVLY